MRKIIVLSAIAALALSACGKTDAVKDPDEGTAAANTLNVKAHEYMFDVEGSPKAGQLSMTIDNTGKELHHAIVGRLDEGKTLEDVKTELAKQQQGGDPPAWFHDEPIDSNVLSPGRAQTISFEAKDAGTYVLLCFMSAPDGAPHVNKGMVATFDVEGTSDAKAPKADATVEMTEYKFSKPEVEAGEVTLAFKNAGKEKHEFIVLKFAEGKKSADIDAWFREGQKGAAPATFYGGTHDFAPGETVFFTATLDAGTYTLVCGVENEEEKIHGDDLGMITEFTVA